MLYVFAGGHRMGSHFQTFVVSHALAQTRRRFQWVDPAAMNTFHLAAIRRALADCDAQADKHFIAKAHAAFPSQIDALLSAQTARVFLIWRPQRDCLVSDYRFAKANAGHSYANFDDYFARRGRRVLLRNRLQEVAWSTRADPRVRSWQYLDLRNDFAHVAGEMLTFAGIDGVDLGKLADGLQIDKLRDKYRDPQGRFFRKGAPMSWRTCRQARRRWTPSRKSRLKPTWPRSAATIWHATVGRCVFLAVRPRRLGGEKACRPGFTSRPACANCSVEPFPACAGCRFVGSPRTPHPNDRQPFPAPASIHRF